MNPSNNDNINENVNETPGSGFTPSASSTGSSPNYQHHQEEDDNTDVVSPPPRRPPCLTMARAAELRSSMSPPTSPNDDDNNSAARLREYQTAMSAISLTELTSYGFFRGAGARREPMASRPARQPLTRAQLQGTIQMVLDIVSEDDF